MSDRDWTSSHLVILKDVAERAKLGWRTVFVGANKGESRKGCEVAPALKSFLLFYVGLVIPFHVVFELPAAW